MAEVVNLRRARKARAKSDREAVAAERRAAFGRPKAERGAQDAQQALDERRLTAHRLRDDETAMPE